MAAGLVEDHPGDAGQHGGEGVHHGHGVFAELEHPGVDEALGVGFVAQRVEPAAALGVVPDQQGTALVDVHRGRHGAAALDREDAGRAAGLHQHGHRVRRAEVH